MTREEFKRLPHLLMEHDVVQLGYGRATIAKFVDCAVLIRVRPAGAGQAKYRKQQLALLLGWEDAAAGTAFAQEPPLLDAKAVQRWTGYSDETLAKIVKAGGLRLVKPPGSGKGKFLKEEIAGLIGFEKHV